MKASDQQILITHLLRGKRGEKSSSDGGKTSTSLTQVLPVEELEVAVDEQEEKKVVVKQSDVNDAESFKNWGK